MECRAIHGLLLVVLVALGAAGTLRRADGGDDLDVAQVARDILEAPESALEAKLKAAAEGRWSPWVLGEHLRAAGARAELLARFATLAEADAPELGAYLRDAARAIATPAMLAGLDDARRHVAGGDGQAALDAIRKAGVPARPATVAGALAARAEAQAARLLPALARSARAGQRAGALAAEIGWRRMGREAWLDGLRMAHAAGVFDVARDCALGLLGIQEAEGDTRGVADSYLDLAGVDYRRGDHAGALRHLEEAVAHYEVLGARHQVAGARSLRAIVRARTGDLRRAREDVRALEADESVFEGPKALADFLTNAAIVYTRLGDLERARSLLDRTLVTARESKDRYAEGLALGNLGLVQRMEGDYDGAIASYTSALGIFQDEGYGLNVALAKLALADGHMQRARVALRGAVELPDEKRAPVVEAAHGECIAGRQLTDEALAVVAGADAAGSVASVLETRCQIQLTLGAFDGLAEEFERVRSEARRLQLWKPQVAASTGLVAVHDARGQWGEALREAREEADRLADSSMGLTDADLARARSFEADVFDLGLRAAAHQGSTVDFHYLLERGRAAALLRGLGGRAAALRATVPAEYEDTLRRRTAEKAAAMAAFSRAVAAGGNREPMRVRKQAYEAARGAESRALADIEALERERASRLLPPRVEVLEDVRRKLASPDAHTVYLGFNLQARDAWCLVADAQGARLVHYGPEHVRPMRSALADVVAERFGEIAPEVVDALRAHLLAPLELPPGKLRLLISPDRELAYVPYGAILPDDAAFAMVPSATTFCLLTEQATRHGRGVLGIGDPDYERMTDREAFLRRGGSRMKQLPEARAEIEAVTVAKEDLRLLGAEATEEGLASALSARAAKPGGRWRVIHIVCHGFVDAEWPSFSALALTPSLHDDGMLTAVEVMRLRLDADLAVLSACETGRGRFTRAEGILGLTRAFMYAGTPRVIASLWKVDDEASRWLMERLHAELRRGVPTAEALRRAQQAVRDRVVEVRGPDGKAAPTRPWQDPRYWAAWVLWGLPN